MFKLILTISAFIIMSAPVAYTQSKAPKTIPSSYSIEKNEFKLSEAINKARNKKNLGELQLSSSLSFVARTHLNDIRLNSKDQHGCSLNSWSDKGKWIPCCFNENQKNLDLMTSKPSEIIGFRGKGYEIVIAAQKGISTSDMAKLWLSSKSTQDFLMNTGKWSNRNWQSIGVSIYKGFASIWASEMPDRMSDVAFEKEIEKFIKSEPDIRNPAKTALAQNTPQSATKTVVPEKRVFLTRGAQPSYVATTTKTAEPEPQPQTKTTKKTAEPEPQPQTKAAKRPEVIIEAEHPVNQEKGTSYFLVHSSYTSLKDAMKAIESLKTEGFKNLVMIDARGKYRVALGIYTTEEAAKAALRKNYPKFDQLKIYNF